MDVDKVKVGLIGSGNISYTYLNTLTQFSIIEMVGCSDLIPEKSKARAETFGIRQMTTDEILADPEIEIVVNTTELFNHNKVTRMALEAGKHVYSEKAMGDNYEGAKANYDLAAEKGLRIGSAPDIYMGAAYQTARKLIDEGMIGTPLLAYALCFRSYPFHAMPFEFPKAFGQRGSSITYDMSGYYINAMVALLGPVQRASGYSRFFEDRVYTNTGHPRYGQKIDKLSGETVMMGNLEFECGCYGSLAMCSEGFSPEIPRVEILGTEGTLTLPDPNYFGGWGNDVYITRVGNPGEKFKVPFTHGFSDMNPEIPTKTGKREPCHNSWRGIAVVDMAWAIIRGRPHRSSAELALHTVEILNAIDNSDATNRVYSIETRPQRPAPLKPGFFGHPTVMEASIDL
jgi:predicted dehydrogenase